MYIYIYIYLHMYRLSHTAQVDHATEPELEPVEEPVAKAKRGSWVGLRRVPVSSSMPAAIEKVRQDPNSVAHGPELHSNQ